MRKKRVKINKKFVDTAPLPGSGQQIYQDSELMGFALRVTPTKKTFIINRRVDTKLIRHKIATYPELTADLARMEAQKILGDLSKGVQPKDKKIKQEVEGTTLEKAFNDYIQIKTLKPKTLKDYKDVMRLQLASLFNKRLADIKRNDVLELHKKISQRSAARANLAMRVLRAVFNFAKATYRLSNDVPLIIENPVSIITDTKTWNRVNRRNSVISVDELPVWYQGVSSLRDGDRNNHGVTRDFLLFTLFTGLRRTEALTLKWEQINFRKNIFTIYDTKNHLEHTLPLTDFLVDSLKRRKAGNPDGFIYVFPDVSKTTHLQEPKSVIKKVSEMTGVKFSTHDLRRTFITIAESLDISHYALKRLLNHKESNDVTSGYIIDDVERLRGPMNAIHNRILELFKTDHRCMAN